MHDSAFPSLHLFGSAKEAQKTQFSDQELGTSKSYTASLVGNFCLSYLVGLVLLASLIYSAGVWMVLANSRFLDFLIRVGVIQYHDKGTGWVEGVADSEFYYQSQLPVDWLLIAVAAGIFLLFWGIKVVQFHGIARHYGIEGSMADHGRAYLYGLGINRLFPFRIGEIATAKVLNGQGAPEDRASATVFATGLLTVFEIAIFACIGLLLMGWTPWLSQVFWSLIIFSVLYLWMRNSSPDMMLIPAREWRKQARVTLQSFTDKPGTLVRLSILSIVAFGLEDIAAYVIANAFLIGIDFSLLVMGIVGSYIARLIPLSPGGVGQFEWGFATALYLGGVGLPEAATIAILDNLLRYVVGTFTLGSILMWFKVETDLGSVFSAFTRSSASVAKH